MILRRWIPLQPRMLLKFQLLQLKYSLMYIFSLKLSIIFYMQNKTISHLPSNKNFGYFFTLLFALIGAYFYYSANLTWVYVFVLTALIFLLLTLVKSDALLPLNKLWMRFGLLLGMIVSPIVLGIIFFGLFTPIAMLMRLIGRDELRLKYTNKASHWISRDEPIKSESFKHQF